MEVIGAKDNTPADGAGNYKATIVRIKAQAGLILSDRAGEGKIVAVRHGSFRLLIEDQPEKVIQEGEMFMVPPGRKFVITILADTETFMVRINIREHFRKNLPLEWMDMLNRENEYSFHTLPIKEVLVQFLDLLGRYISDEVRSYTLYNNKVREMLLLLTSYYDPRSLAVFFYPLFRIDSEFTAFVLQNHHKYRTVKELAEASCYSLSSFNKLFRKAFGTSPYSWIKDQKAKRVYYDLTMTSLPIKEIWRKHGYGTASHFTHFCNQQFGMCPKKIRKDGLRGYEIGVT